MCIRDSTRTYKIRRRRKGNKKVITKKGKRDGQEKHSDLSLSLIHILVTCAKLGMDFVACTNKKYFPNDELVAYCKNVAKAVSYTHLDVYKRQD